MHEETPNCESRIQHRNLKLAKLEGTLHLAMAATIFIALGDKSKAKIGTMGDKTNMDIMGTGKKLSDRNPNWRWCSKSHSFPGDNSRCDRELKWCLSMSTRAAIGEYPATRNPVLAREGGINRNF